MNSSLKSIVRYLSRWAWREEADLSESFLKLRELHIKDGAMEAEIEQRPEAAMWMAQVFASFLVNCPNYREIQFEARNPRERFRRILVHVQKCEGKTPHELRQEAEARIKELEAQLATLDHA